MYTKYCCSMDGLECDLHAPDLLRLACVRDALQELAHAPRAEASHCAHSDCAVPDAWTVALASAVLAAGVSLASVWWATRGTWRRTPPSTDADYDDDGDVAARN